MELFLAPVVTRNIIGIGVLAVVAICSVGLYSYYSPDIWIKDVRKAAQDGDKERLRDLIDFDSVRTGLKEEVRAELVTSIDANLKDNPFSALGLAMVSLMVDPVVDMIISPSGIAALIEKGKVQSSKKNTDTREVAKARSGFESMRVEQGYESISRYRIRIRSDGPTEEPIVLSLRREGLFSWRLSRISLPSKLLGGAEALQNPSQISIDASDMQAPEATRPDVIRFTATLRNHANRNVGYPALDLTFTDSMERVLARRILEPKQYLGQGTEITKGIPAGAKIEIRLELSAGKLNPSGFRLDLISPDILNGKDVEVRPNAVQLLRVLSGSGEENALPVISTAKACLEWGAFAGAAVGSATDALERSQLPMSQIERVVSSGGGYWVHIPPLRTKDEIDRKVAELQALGIREFFVVQEVGEWRNAISLGIFRTDEGAQAFLTQLRARGVRLALVERRENFIKDVTFYVRDPGKAEIEQLARIQRDFPGSELKAAPCPAVAQNK